MIDVTDYWDDDVELDDFSTGGSGCLSFYIIPPLAAIGISCLLMGFMARYGFQRIADLDLSGMNLPAITGQIEPFLEEDAGEDRSGIAPFFAPAVQYWESNIVRWAAERNLDPDLVATVMQIESCGHPQIASSAGAIGLFQVMPFHFQPGEDPTHPDTNANRGLAYLLRSLEAGAGNIRQALAGYNAGIGGASRGEAGWPAETLRYAYWGTGIFSDAESGKKESSVLQEWLASGGASLCQRAAQALGISP